MSLPRLRHSTPAFRTFSGERALESLVHEFARTGSSRVVLFHGASMGRHDLVLEKVVSAIGERLVGRFDRVQEHSPVPVVQEAAAYLADADADAVIALGGGSAIVTARAATILHAEGGDIRDLCTRREGGRLVSPRLEAPKIPQWVIPSTPTTAYAKAGSAVRDPSSGERLALFDPKTRAQGIFLDPDVALTAPVGAMQNLFKKTGWKAEDVDLYEINEAFAVVTMAAMKEFDLPHAKVNMHGGATARGHPIGASGARLLVTLIGALKKTGGKRGVATLCIGGGEAVAMAIEMI